MILNYLQFQKLSNIRETSGSAVVLGSSPSVRCFNFEKFDGIRIGVGDMPWRAPEFGPYDYWVCANTQYPLPWLEPHARSMNKSNTKNLVLSTVAFSELKYLEAGKTIERLNKRTSIQGIILYDHIHNRGQLCTPLRGCCYVYKNYCSDETIQQLLNHRSGNTKDSYSGIWGVAFHGLALAIILGANPIYVAGIDLPARRADYKYINPRKLMLCKSQPRIFTALNRKRESLFSQNSIWHDRQAVIAELQILVQIASIRGITIINTSPTSVLNEVIGVRSA